MRSSDWSSRRVLFRSPFRMELQFLQRAVHRRITGLTFDVGIKFRGREAGSALITFQLGHVDAVRRKAAHRLVKRGGYILNFKKKGGQRRSIDPPAIGRFRKHSESSNIVLAILHTFGRKGK